MTHRPQAREDAAEAGKRERRAILVHRIEGDDTGYSIGAAFEVAAIIDIRLFDAEPTTLTRHLGMVRDKLTLLPKAVRQSPKAVKDDF